MTTRPIRAAVDVGGTFTDVQILDITNGQTWSLKTPTTPDDPGRGIVTGLSKAASRFGFALADIGLLIHGTTIATNAVLEKKVATGALLTTSGFEDVLEIGRHVRRDIYSAIAEERSVLIPRARRFGVPERVRANGTIEIPLDQRAIASIAAAVRSADVDAVAICLLHAYSNPIHEELLAEGIRAHLPDAHISCSHAVSPELREFERTSTTVLNAVLMPVVGDYLRRLEVRLVEAGIDARLLLFQSNGGVLSPAQAMDTPVRLLLSGPAGGALAVQTLGRFSDESNLVGIDMGGTSFDVCVVEKGEIREITQGDVAGFPVRVPMLEIRTISAGGGSIARVDASGRALVGPDSAGARPGPAAYGHGGAAATVTDANVALGRLDASQFLNGEMVLDIAAAERAIQSNVAAPLDLETHQAADGVIRVAVAQMAAAMRLSLFEKGLDPRDFTLMSFGGAAGLHAAEVAVELGASRVLYPANSATLSAWGMLYADVTLDYAATRLLDAVPDTASALNEMIIPLRLQALDDMRAEGFVDNQIKLNLSADMRYKGQAYEIPVPWDGVTADTSSINAAVTRFHGLHLAQFAHCDEQVVPEILTLRLRAVGQLPAPPDASGTQALQDSSAAQQMRDISVAGTSTAVPVVVRSDITSPLAGPLIVEEPHTTIVIPTGWQIAPSRGGCLAATRLDIPEGVQS